ncbi:MAG: hypothetical protein RIR52_738, partial [Acidobacteriota bacterium]
MKMKRYFDPRSAIAALLLVALLVMITGSGRDVSGQRTAEVSESVLTQAGLADYALQQRAQNLVDGDRSEEAEQVFRQLARRHPTSILSRSANLQAAGIAFRRGRYQQTLEDLAGLVEKRDGSALKLSIEALLK